MHHFQKIGEILKKHGIVSDIQLDAASKTQSEYGYLFGECLLHNNSCNIRDIDTALTEQRIISAKHNESVSYYTIFSSLFKVDKVKSDLALIVFFTLISASFSYGIIFSIYVNIIVSDIIPSKDVSSLYNLLALSALAITIGMLSSFQSRYFSLLLSSKVLNNILCKVFEHLNRISPVTFGKTNKENVIAAYSTDSENISRIITACLSQGLPNFITIIISSALLISYNWILALVALTATGLMILLPILITDRASKHIALESENIADLFAFSKISFDSVEQFKLSSPDSIIEKFKEKYLNHHINQCSKWMFWNLSDNKLLALNQLFLLSIIFCGGIFVLRGEIQLGALISYYILALSIQPRVSQLFVVYQSMQSLRNSWCRFAALIQHPISSNDQIEKCIVVKESFNLLKFEKVSYKHKYDTPNIFSDLNLSFNAGEVYAVIGKSGVGKTTFVKLLTGEIKPCSGTIFIDEHDTKGFSRDEYLGWVSSMLQDPIILNGTFSENILLNVQNTNLNPNIQDMITALKKVSLFDNKDTMIEILNSSQPCEKDKYSLGEKQRLSLARSLLKNAPIQVFDEPTSSLDKESKLIIMNELIKAEPGKIRFIITHDVDFMKKCNRILVIKSSGIYCYNKENRLSNNFYEDLISECVNKTDSVLA